MGAVSKRDCEDCLKKNEEVEETDTSKEVGEEGRLKKIGGSKE